MIPFLVKRRGGYRRFSSFCLSAGLWKNCSTETQREDVAKTLGACGNYFLLFLKKKTLHIWPFQNKGHDNLLSGFAERITNAKDDRYINNKSSKALFLTISNVFYCNSIVMHEQSQINIHLYPKSVSPPKAPALTFSVGLSGHNSNRCRFACRRLDYLPWRGRSSLSALYPLIYDI